MTERDPGALSSQRPSVHRPAPARLPSQDETSAELAADVDAFLANGGAVQEVADGATGLDPKTGLPLGTDPRKARQISLLGPPGKPAASKPKPKQPVDWKKRMQDAPPRRKAAAAQPRRRSKVPKADKQPRPAQTPRTRRNPRHREDLTPEAFESRTRAVLAAAAAATRATLEEALTIKGRGRKTIGTRARQLAALVLDDQPDRYLVELCSTARDRASNWRTVAKASDDAQFHLAAKRLREAAAGEPPWTALEALQRELAGDQGTVLDERVDELRRWYDTALRIAEIETRAALEDLRREDGTGPRDPDHVQRGRALAARCLELAGATYAETSRLLGISDVAVKKRCLLASTVPALEDSAREVLAFLGGNDAT